MSDTPEDPLPVSAGQPGSAARARDPGRPASRAEATGRTPARHRIGIRELRQHASVYVDLAEKGYTVDITNRGRLVAQLVPVREPGSPLERLIAAGIVKLALTEPESAALAHWLAERAGQPLVSSALYRAEVPRAVWQAEPGALPRSYKVIKRIARVALSADVLDNSATLPPQELSPAQAIHLASALAMKRDLTAFVSYDQSLLAAARNAGLPVASPGAP